MHRMIPVPPFRAEVEILEASDELATATRVRRAVKIVGLIDDAGTRKFVGMIPNGPGRLRADIFEEVFAELPA